MLPEVLTPEWNGEGFLKVYVTEQLSSFPSEFLQLRKLLPSAESLFFFINNPGELFEVKTPTTRECENGFKQFVVNKRKPPTQLRGTFRN